MLLRNSDLTDTRDCLIDKMLCVIQSPVMVAPSRCGFGTMQPAHGTQSCALASGSANAGVSGAVEHNVRPEAGI